MEFTAMEAEKLALDFLMRDWNVPSEHWDWFSVLNSRPIGEDWYVVEIGIEGLPDRWVLQVYDTGECDPCYTFTSPISESEHQSDLADLPEWIAQVLVAERQHR